MKKILIILILLSISLYSATTDEEIFKTVRYGSSLELKNILDSGVNINIQDNDGKTPLRIAVESSFPKKVKLLLEAGADITIKDKYGQDVLMWAHSVEITNILLDAGADINSQDNDGFTPLMITIVNGDDLKAKELIKLGANINIKNDNGDNALYLAIVFKRTEIIDILKSKGAKLWKK